VAVSAPTALQTVRDGAQVQSGQQVLIIGASGGVGTFAVQIAKAFGAEVTGMCRTSKADIVRSAGADHVIDYTCEDITAGGRSRPTPRTTRPRGPPPPPQRPTAADHRAPQQSGTKRVLDRRALKPYRHHRCTPMHQDGPSVSAKTGWRAVALPQDVLTMASHTTDSNVAHHRQQHGADTTTRTTSGISPR
jgi:NAD(P)-dependent dehydrogenase (short-subunit alcohol dehydrogenase family)